MICGIFIPPPEKGFRSTFYISVSIEQIPTKARLLDNFETSLNRCIIDRIASVTEIRNSGSSYRQVGSSNHRAPA